MGLQTKRGFCKDCNDYRKLERQTANHVFHLLVAIFTLGIWIPFWFLLSFRAGGWKCSQCGSKKTGLLNKIV